MATVLFFAQARDAAGCRSTEVAGDTVAGVLEEIRGRFGPEMSRVLEISAVWVNGEPAELDSPVQDADEVAVLPPVSGG